MANGSFGLSGLPTAPTTLAVDSAIKTPLTAATVPITTTSGFQANDLVYFKNGNFGPVPDNATASATFPVNTAVSNYNSANSGSTGSGLTKVLDSINTGTYALDVSQSTGIANARLRFADTLANGNIIVVFEDKLDFSAGRCLACVYSEEGVQLYGPVSLGFTYEHNMVGVRALPNGNAVVYWSDSSSGKWTWTTVSNTLSVVLAAQVLDSATLGNSNRNCFIDAAARSDSSVVFGWTNTTDTNIYQKVVNSTTGANVYASTNVGVAIAKYYNISIAVRGDNSWVIAFISTTAYVNVRHWSSTNTSLYNFNTLNNAVPTYNWGGIVTLSDGTNLLTYANSNLARFRTYNGAGSMGAMTSYTATGVSAIVGSFATPTTGGYMLTVYTNNSSVDYTNQALTYLYNNANVNTGSLTYNRVSGQILGTEGGFTGIKGNTYFHILSNNVYGGVGFDFNTGPRTLSWSRLSLADVTNVPWASVTASLGNTAAQGVFGYARSGSTPTAAAFYPSSTGSVPYTQVASTSQATLVKAQTIIESSVVSAMDSCTLSNGNVVFIYKLTTHIVKCAVYTNAGVLVTNFVVDSTTVNSADHARLVSICALGNGNFVVSWFNTGATFQVSWRIYNGTTYGTIASGVNTIANQSPANNRWSQVCSYSNDRWFLAYVSTGTYATYELRSSTGTLLTSDQINTFGGANCVSIQAGGSLLSILLYTAPNWYTVSRPETNTNSFGNYSWDDAPPAYSSNEFFGNKSKTGSFGSHVFLTPNGANNVSINEWQRNYGAQLNQGGLLSIPSTSSANVGVTSNGDIVVTALQSSDIIRLVVVNNSISNTSGYTQTDINGFSFYASGSNALTCMNLTNTFGNQMVIGWLNTSQFPTFTIFAVKGQTGNVLLTAGVTVSNAELTLSPTNGYYLTGVSTASASANGTANVQINGSISLNSSYSASTAYSAFDFSNPTLYGVRGTIVGRNITMQGNV
jgi:hypothetical protein